MHWINDYQLFLFDFDGLLVNTESIHFQAYINTLARRGFELNWSFDEFCMNAHFTSDGLQKAVYSEFPKLQEQEPNWNILYAEKKRAYIELLTTRKVELMPGVKRLLSELERKKIKRCVVTNSLKEQTDLIQANQPILKTIPHWITREDYQEPKPHPECYLEAIKKHGALGDRIIGFEDSARGLKALLGTPAQPVLICPQNHPQLNATLDAKVVHYASFEEIPDTHIVEV